MRTISRYDARGVLLYGNAVSGWISPDVCNENHYDQATSHRDIYGHIVWNQGIHVYGKMFLNITKIKTNMAINIGKDIFMNQLGGNWWFQLNLILFWWLNMLSKMAEIMYFLSLWNINIILAMFESFQISPWSSSTFTIDHYWLIFTWSDG